MVRPLLTGICGSDSKQVLLDFEGDSDSAMSGLCSFPQVLGHEVVAEVVKEAVSTHRSIRAVVRERDLLPDEQLDALLDPLALTRGGLPQAPRAGEPA